MEPAKMKYGKKCPHERIVKDRVHLMQDTEGGSVASLAETVPIDSQKVPTVRQPLTGSSNP
jgi:hypothetical protein